MAKNNQIDPKNSAHSEILLPKTMDYQITRTGPSYNTKINVTCRSMRNRDGTLTESIATTSVEASALSSLRLEKMNDEYYVVNGPIQNELTKDLYSKSFKFKVLNETVGYHIIKDILNEFNRDQNIYVPEKYTQANILAERFSPLIITACGLLLTLSTSFWLIFN